MATTINDRLSNLKVRRRGIPTYTGQLDEALEKASVKTEAYERRSTRIASQYALGAMQEVDPAYTGNSYAEGDRIKSQLTNRLPGSYSAEFHYQGSVPLNVHIKGVSDIDLLVLRTDFLTVDPAGPRYHFYADWAGDPPLQALRALRTTIASELRSAFPEVKVDVSGSKCITLTGGSLRRNIDVIPSHWHDTADWQTEKVLANRGIKILNNAEGTTVLNMPFRHIAMINRKDISCLGGAKKVIRLLKNLSADSDIPDAKKLSSYDIASLVWHISENQLAVPVWNELSLVASTQEALSWFANNPLAASTLRTPDDSRAILDKPEKARAVALLLNEVNLVADNIVAELSPYSDRMKTLRESYVGAD